MAAPRKHAILSLRGDGIGGRDCVGLAGVALGGAIPRGNSRKDKGGKSQAQDCRGCCTCSFHQGLVVWGVDAQALSAPASQRGAGLRREGVTPP